MALSYQYEDFGDGWNYIDWFLFEAQLDQQIANSTEAQNISYSQDLSAFYHGSCPTYIDQQCGHRNDSFGSSIDFPTQDVYGYQQTAPSYMTPNTETSTNEKCWPEYFDKLPLRTEPPNANSLQAQPPRFEGDMYTAPYIKGEGVDRAGWCGFCSSWHKLKDSAFWYHMHYSHGVSYATGRQLNGPRSIQWDVRFNGWRARCGRCNTWLTLGKDDRAAKTAYYRHAYQCHVRDNPEFERLNGVKKSRSPRKPRR